MAAKLIKLTEGLDIDDSLGDNTSELSLVDDGDVGGALSTMTCQLEIDASIDEREEVFVKGVHENRVSPPTQPTSSCNDLESQARSSCNDLESQAMSSEAVHFEVVKARIVKEKRSKYVLYTMVILRTTQQTESSYAVIERRYSDLERFYGALQVKFPDLMQAIAFPRKILAGNFDQKVIAQRSRGFEQFLSHINSINEIRLSPVFADFFYAQDLKRAHEYIRDGKFDDSIPLFLNTLTLQDQLLGQHHKEVVATLCGLVAAYDANDNAPEACRYALSALRRIGKSENNRFLIPLLQAAIRLCWRLGKDKTDLEQRLADLRKRSFPIDLAPSLMGLTLNRFSE